MEMKAGKLTEELRKIEKFLLDSKEQYVLLNINKDGTRNKTHQRDMMRETLDLFEESKQAEKVLTEEFTFLPAVCEPHALSAGAIEAVPAYIGVAYRLYVTARTEVGEVSVRTLSLFSDDRYIFDGMGPDFPSVSMSADFKSHYRKVDHLIKMLLNEAAKRKEVLQAAGFRILEKAST